MEVPGQLLDAAVGPGGTRLLVALAAVLAAGTLLRAVRARRRPGPESRGRLRSAFTWWALFGLLVAVVLVGRVGLVVTMAVVCFLALREALHLAPAGNGSVRSAGAVFVVYGWALLEWRSLFLVGIPAAVAAWLAAGVARRAGILPVPEWTGPVGVALYEGLAGPAYVVAVAALVAETAPGGTPMGWVLLLLLLTGMNDIAQAWWGRRLGERRLAPERSPRKTWEGAVGGVVTTAGVAVLAAPVVTAWGRSHPPGLELAAPPALWSALLGAVVGVAGIAGDLTASGLKRRAGVDDSGSLLPGQGGVLDRVDSLAITAPVFLALTWLLWAGAP